MIKEAITRQVYMDERPLPHDNVLIMDSGAEISCVGQGFSILTWSGETVSLGTVEMQNEKRTYDIVSAATVIIDETSSIGIIIIINQAAHFPSMQQHESLLHTEQATL
jgi:hypothetical protein